MSMTVKRIKDVATPRIFMHKIADIRGGVQINHGQNSGYIPEGTIIGHTASSNAKNAYEYLPVAQVVAAVAESDKTVKVQKLHLLSVGDAVMIKPDGKAVKITKIDASAKDCDVITLNAALGEISKGTFLVKAKEEADGTTKKSALDFSPVALVGTGKVMMPGDNVITDAWVMGVTKGYPLPDFIANKLKGIINID